MIQQVSRHKCSTSDLSVIKDHVEYIRMTSTREQIFLVLDFVSGSQSKFMQDPQNCPISGGCRSDFKFAWILRRDL